MLVKLNQKSYSIFGKGSWFVMFEDLFSYNMIYCETESEQLVWYEYYCLRGYYVCKGFAERY